MASVSASITQGCAGGQGVLTLTSAGAAPGSGSNLSYEWQVRDAAGNEYGGAFTPSGLPTQSGGLPNGPVTARVYATNDLGTSYSSRLFNFDVACSAAPGVLTLDTLAHTDETAALNDGTATIQASGGTAPLTASVVETGATAPATSGQPHTFTGLAGGNPYTLRITDSTSPTPQVVQGTVDVQAYAPPVLGCLDEYADNYDALATADNVPPSCSYSARWRSAWQPMAVRVAAVAGQTAAYIVADLRVGFRPGHPLAADRPLGAPLRLRATVGPDGYATFVLGPYLRPQLGAPDGAGGYRLDLNSPTAYTADLYVGYELRRADGTLLEHGYALNSAVPDATLVSQGPNFGHVLSPFAVLPLWPGFDDYAFSLLRAVALPVVAYGVVQAAQAGGYDFTQALPCPSNPLPVAWLAPGGGYGFWVFQGRSVIGDQVADGQRYRDASTGEQRYSDPGESYRTVKASSGIFRGDDLLEGLRTLWRSPQAWYQPIPGGEWVPIVVERGSREVGRLGVLRNELSLSFSVAAPEWAQGQ